MWRDINIIFIYLLSLVLKGEGPSCQLDLVSISTCPAMRTQSLQLSSLMMQAIVKPMASKPIMACDELILDTVLIHQSFHYSNESYYI